jgi:hypothetical protein
MGQGHDAVRQDHEISVELAQGVVEPGAEQVLFGNPAACLGFDLRHELVNGQAHPV